MGNKKSRDSNGFQHIFEKKKIVSLNKFFMKNVITGLLLTLLLFALTIGSLIFTLTLSDIEPSVKISVISMIVAFVITTSKSLLDRIIEIVIYIVRLLGEEQRGLGKKMGIEVDEVEFGDLLEEDKKEDQPDK